MMTFDFTRYDDTRNSPSIDGSSKLSPYTRFGLISIRELYRELLSKNDPSHTATYLSELARREFWQHIAHHFPESRIMEFQEKKRKIARDNNKELFKSYSDYLLVEPEEVIPMKVFTPFKNRWLKELDTKDYSKSYTIDKITTPMWSQKNYSFSLYR